MKLEIGKNISNKLEDGKILCNWSGGVASAVACYIALEVYGDKCELIHLVTNAEHPDTYRFMFDFQQRLGVQILELKSEKFNNPEEVWDHYGTLNVATGAPCSSELKRDVAIKFRKTRTYWAEVFGFDITETRRADNMWKNYPGLNPVYPLIQNGLDKEAAFAVLNKLGLRIPEAYKNFRNNNCLGDPESEKGGCVQGGIGYWQRLQEIYPKKFNYMAKKEHELTDKKGQPVTVLRNKAKTRFGEPLFLRPHPDYPQYQHIGQKKGRYKVLSFECHGFCNTTEKDL